MFKRLNFSKGGLKEFNEIINIALVSNKKLAIYEIRGKTIFLNVTRRAGFFLNRRFSHVYIMSLPHFHSHLLEGAICILRYFLGGGFLPFLHHTNLYKNIKNRDCEN